MNTFALVSLFSFLICIFLGAFILFRNPFSKLNRLCMGLCVILAMQAFIEFGYRSSRSFEEASFWWHLDFIWPLISAVVLRLSLEFTDSQHYLRKKAIFLLIYGPMVVFMSADGFGHLITGPPIEQTWGWSYSTLSNILSNLSAIWIVGVLGISIVLVGRFSIREPDARKRKHAKFLGVGLVIGFAMHLVDYGLRAFDITFPGLVVQSTILTNIFIGIAIWKHEMFALTPVAAADSILATMTDSLLLVSPDSRILSSNSAARRLLGYGEDELAKMHIDSIFSKDSERPVWLQETENTTGERERKNTYIETNFVTKNGEVIPISLAGSALYDSKGYLQGFVFIARDITDRKKAYEELQKYRYHLEELVEQRTAELTQSHEQLQRETIDRIRAEEDRANLEEQLHQSQKMEAIGRLAGGVAHDFNNLLFVITGYTESFLASMDFNDPMREDAEEISKAAKRASALTQQLLAFSRKQVISPKVIDLHDTFASVENMLGRIIGEDIELVFAPSRNLGCILMDPVQVDQVLANLFVNARDAMPGGGRLRVEARNVRVDQAHKARNPEAKPGKYVLLSVSDTGCGMDQKTLSKIFEPFFTTKGRGKGTGLGLSTVYGIVKQNQGFIEVDSTPGGGTNFNIYIPQAKSDAENEELVMQGVVPTGSETILLVEDEPMVRRLASQLLKRQGYSVLEAIDAREAQAIFQRQRGEIDLLFTDIVMPGMSGRQLSEYLSETKPDLRVLYMSGHNDEIIDQHGCLNSEVPMIQKPFSSVDLSWKVREVLDN